MLKIIYDNDFTSIAVPPCAYEIESLNNEIKRNINDEEHFTKKKDYQFTIKPNFSTLGSFIKISKHGAIISFLTDDSIRDILGVDATTFYGKNKLSPSPADILSFDNVFLATDFARGMFLRGKRSGIIHNSTMTVNPKYKDEERLHGGVQW